LTQNRNLECANIFAPDYDRVVPSNGWCAPEIVFDLMSDHIRSGDTLLDIGIGTGLSALPFKNAGLTIYGVDGSTEMIKICESKKIASDLKLCDLSTSCFPYESAFFNHVISAGVFHLLGDLNQIISEVSRVLLKGGLLCLTFDDLTRESDKKGNVLSDGDIIEHINDKSKIKSYRHSDKYVSDLLIQNDLSVMNEASFP
jgi:predicted TPR repeat methyltransferase